MPNPQVIVNTSPLLYLHQVGYLELLQRLYSQILTPPAVIEELAIGKNKGIDVPNIQAIEWMLTDKVVNMDYHSETVGQKARYWGQKLQRIALILMHHVIDKGFTLFLSHCLPIKTSLLSD